MFPAHRKFFSEMIYLEFKDDIFKLKLAFWV